MSQRPTRVSGIHRPESIERISRRNRREAQRQRLIAQEAQRRVAQEEKEEGDSSSQSSGSSESSASSDSRTMANQLPALLRLADTNPYTNLSDLTTENGRRLWRQASKPLSDKFDGSHQNFQNFSAAITNRFKMCNWLRFIILTSKAPPGS